MDKLVFNEGGSVIAKMLLSLLFYTLVIIGNSAVFLSLLFLLRKILTRGIG